MWPIVSILFGTVKDDVILLSTRICGFTTHWSWDRELYAYRVFRIGNLGSPQKQHSYAQGYMLCLHYTLCLMQLSVVCNLILMEFSDWFATSGLLAIDAVGWRSMYLVVMPRVNLIVILLSYGETPLVNCGPRSYFHYIAITCLLYLHCLLYSYTITIFHLIRSFLCLQQTGEIDNLIVCWEQSILVVLCAGSVLQLAKQSLDEAPYKFSGAVAS
jgi:hypothetical protein